MHTYIHTYVRTYVHRHYYVHIAIGYTVLPAVAAVTSVVFITVSRIEVVDTNDELLAEGKMLDTEFDKTIDVLVKTDNDEVVDTDGNVILDDDTVRD